MYIIKDWANNILDYKGVFKTECLAVPLQFDTFEEAWAYLYRKFDHLNDKDFDDQMNEFEVECVL